MTIQMETKVLPDLANPTNLHILFSDEELHMIHVQQAHRVISCLGPMLLAGGYVNVHTALVRRWMEIISMSEMRKHNTHYRGAVPQTDSYVTYWIVT
jgi:hypothetical protein